MIASLAGARELDLSQGAAVAIGLDALVLLRKCYLPLINYARTIVRV